MKQESGTYEMLAVLHFNMVEFRSQLKSHREKIRDLADQSFLFFDVLRRIPNRIRNPVETRDQGTQCPDALDLVNEKKYSILPMHGLDFTLNQVMGSSLGLLHLNIMSFSDHNQEKV